MTVSRRHGIKLTGFNRAVDAFKDKFAISDAAVRDRVRFVMVTPPDIEPALQSFTEGKNVTTRPNPSRGISQYVLHIDWPVSNRHLRVLCRC